LVGQSQSRYQSLSLSVSQSLSLSVSQSLSLSVSQSLSLSVSQSLSLSVTSCSSFCELVYVLVCAHESESESEHVCALHLGWSF
jgi:hypothetical protein